MKNIFKNTIWIALGAIALSACSTDNTEELLPAGTPPEIPGEGRTVTVIASLSDQTKASFSDGESIKWAVGDQIKWSNGATSNALTADDLSENGTVANFTIEVPRNADGWFHSTTTHPGNNNEVEFTLGSATGYAYTQEQAGSMNTRYLFLHSGAGTMQIPAEAETISLKMEIAGSVFRIVPYTEKYNGEQIQKVLLVSNSNLAGTVAYDHEAQTYRGVDDINWQVSKEIVVDLKEPFALTDAASRETGKGIYMAVARTTAPLDGYKYIVDTDKATYTFDAMDKQLEVSDNTVKNVFLNLDKAERLGNDEYIYDVRYTGDFNIVENTLWSSDAHPEIAQGYWFAQAAPKGTQEWTNMDNINEENKKFYNVTYEIIDNATHAPADWVTVTHAWPGTAWRIALTENTAGVERSATITGTYPAKIEGGYILLPGYETKSVVIRQEAKIDIQATLSEIHTGIVPKEGETIAAAKLALTVNGAAAEDVNAAMQQYGITASCGAASATVDARGYITIRFPENKTADEKEFALHINYKNEAIATASYTQEAGSGEVETFPYTYTIVKNNGNGIGAIWGMNPNSQNGADFSIKDVALNGKAVSLDETTANEILAYAFKNLEATAEEKGAGYAAYNYMENIISVGIVNFNGSDINVGVKTGDGKGYFTKLAWYEADGTQAGYWFVFIPF